MSGFLTGQIEIRLLSEAIFDSGEKESHLVHSRVLSDKYGFVYYHAKTLKGQLKKQAFWLMEQYKCLDQGRAAAFWQSIDWLFGVNKDERELHWSEDKRLSPTTGMLRLGALELPAAVRKYYTEMLREQEQSNYYSLSRHDLIAAQTYVRSGIELNEKTGTVVDKALVTYHTVREDLIFYAPVTFEARPGKSELEDLKRIVHSLRHIGAGVHRGRGEVEARLFI